MSTRTSLFGIVLTLALTSSSCLTVTTRVTTVHPGGGDVCFDDGKIPCDRDCDSFEDCEAPNNCCRGLCDKFKQH
jgi:hypothetical protein